MTTLKFSIAIHFILCCTILFFSVEKVNGRDVCTEAYPWVKVVCDVPGEVVDQPCWDECQNRHGLKAKASCHTPSPAFPNYVICYCSWPC